MHISATIDEKIKTVYDCLCTGMPYFGDYGFEMGWSPSEYANARATVCDNDGACCYEDVLKEMLQRGNTITFKSDDDGAYKLNRVTIENNWDKVPMHRIVEMIDETFDAITADVIMQSILFGEVVYG